MVDITTVLDLDIAFSIGLLTGAGMTRLLLRQGTSQVRSGTFWTIRRKLLVVSFVLIGILGIAELIILG